MKCVPFSLPQDEVVDKEISTNNTASPLVTLPSTTPLPVTLFSFNYIRCSPLNALVCTYHMYL